MAAHELPVIFAPSQRFSTSLSGKRCDFGLHYNEWSGRWSLDLAVDGVPKLSGRRIVVGTDLLPPSLGLGRLVALDWAKSGARPGRTELPSGAVRLIHVD